MEIQKYFSLINEVWNDSGPLAKLFRTEQRGYIYDTGTNHIIGCEEVIFELLKNLFSMEVEPAIRTFLREHGEEKFIYAAESIKTSIEKLQVLRFKRGEAFMLTDEKSSIEELIHNYLEVMLLEVTENCNLRCGYCPYNPGYEANRNHGQRDMSMETVEKALLYLKSHSSGRERVGLSIYGGEPIANFKLIRYCVKTAHRLFKNKEIGFNVTTNGTLITPEIARFLFENGFFVTTSIDGIEPIHNSFRKYSTGKGSYQDSIRGLKYLIDAYGDSAEKKLRINMVYTPPFSSQRLESIAALWDQNKWLPMNLKTRIVYPSFETIPIELIEDNTPEDKTIEEWAFEKYREAYRQKHRSHPLVNSIIEPSLAGILNRPLLDSPEPRMNLNGCCVPGAKRLYVSVNGTFHVCEKIDSNAPPIGNVYSGVNLDIVKSKYINRCMEIAFPGCSTCWASRLCDACYISAFKDGILNAESKFNNCSIIKYLKEKSMKFFCTLLEDNPKGLDHLMDTQIKR